MKTLYWGALVVSTSSTPKLNCFRKGERSEGGIDAQKSRLGNSPVFSKTSLPQQFKSTKKNDLVQHQAKKGQKQVLNMNALCYIFKGWHHQFATCNLTGHVDLKLGF